MKKSRLEKPVIIFTVHYVKNYHKDLKASSDFYIEDVGMNEVNLDENAVLSDKNFNIDKTKYRDFKTKYLKDNYIQENFYYYAIRHIKNKFRRRKIKKFRSFLIQYFSHGKNIICCF